MKLKNTFGNIEHSNDDQSVTLTANQTLSDMKEIYDAYKIIKKVHGDLKKWKKAVDAGIKTQTEYEAILIKANKIIATQITYSCGFGLGLGQGDDCDYSDRAAAFAKNIVDDATNK